MTDTRNVADQFKGWETDLIKTTLDLDRHPFSVCMFQLQGDFNFGTVVRNANAFGAEKVFYIGKKKWDRRAAVGAHNYINVKYYATWTDFLRIERDNYAMVALEQSKNSWPLDTIFQWPIRPCIVIGEEGDGLPLRVVEDCDGILEIPQYGSVRSLNAGVASGIAMYDFTSKL